MNDMTTPRACYRCGTYEPIAALVNPHEELCLNEELIASLPRPPANERGISLFVVPWICTNEDSHYKPQCDSERDCARRQRMNGVR